MKTKKLSYPAEKVRAQMGAQQLTVEELALKSKTGKNTVSKVRAGKPVNTHTLCAILRELGLEIDFRPTA